MPKTKNCPKLRDVMYGRPLFSTNIDKMVYSAKRLKKTSFNFEDLQHKILYQICVNQCINKGFTNPKNCSKRFHDP